MRTQAPITFILLLIDAAHSFLYNREACHRRGSSNGAQRPLTMRVSNVEDSDENHRLLKAVLEKVTHMAEDVTSLKEDVTSLKEDVTSLKKDVSSMDKQLGLMWEAEGRKSAEVLFGTQYAKGLVARSIQDLCYCLPADIIKGGDYRGQCLRVPLELTIRMIKRLVDESVPERLLQCIAGKLEV